MMGGLEWEETKLQELIDSRKAIFKLLKSSVLATSFRFRFAFTYINNNGRNCENSFLNVFSVVTPCLFK